MVEKKNPFLRRQSEPYKKRVGESKSHKIGSITQGHRPKQATKIQNLLQLLRDWKAGKYPNVPLAGLLYRMNYSTGKLGPAGGSNKPGKHLRYFLRDFLDNNTRVTNYNPKYGLREYVTQKDVVEAVGTENVRELKTALSKSGGIKTRIGAVGRETSRKALLARKADLAKLANDPVIQKLMNTGQGTIKIVRGKELNNVMTDLVDQGMKVLDMNSNQVERRLNMLGIALKNKDPDLPKFTNDKMIQKISKAGSFSGAGKLLYGIETAKALGQADNFIDRSLRDISIKLKDAGIKGYNLDEIFGGTSSGLRKSYPYGVFGQIIRGGKATRGLFKRPTIDQEELINQLKGSDIDARKSITEDNLQNIDREYEKYKAAKNNPSKHRGSRYGKFPDRLTKNGLKMRTMQDFNRMAQKFKRQHGVAVPLFSDKPPSQVVKDYHNFKNPNSKFYFDIGEGKYLSDALDDVHKKFGYSMVVPKNTGTLKTILKDLDNPTIIETLRSKVKRLPPRIYGPVIGAYLGYQGFKNLFNTPLNADTSNLMTAGISGGTTIPKVDLVPRTVVDEQVTEVAETPTTEQMTYNATTGEFDNAEGDPETQEGILNWIADHPVYSGLAPIPIGIGAGLGAEAMGAKQVGEFFKSMKFILPPAYAAEKLHQYKRGDDMGQMFANPIDAVWAMALDTKDSRNIKWEHYKNIAKTRPGWGAAAATKAGEKAAIEAEQLGLRHLDPRKFKETGAALKRATMAPRSFGTSLVFPFAGPKAGAGAGMKVFRGALRMAPLGPLPMALLAGSMAWDKYKFNKEVGNHVDALRARGVVSEEDAQSMNTIYKQGWLGTTAIGAKILGSEELMLDGELADIEKQKQVLAKMKSFYEDEERKGKEYRAGERQEDFFDWFSKGGRVGLKEGGQKPPFSMTRRGFLKWLVGSIVAGTAALSGKGLKQLTKTAVPTVTKGIPTKFAGVEGMPLWFPRAVAKIKAHGKLIQMADKHYVGGDLYEMMIPVKVPKFDRVAGKELPSGFTTRLEKVTMSDNPLTGEINMHWTGTDNFGDDAIREINFRPGQAGYQKFGVDDPEAAAQGITEYRRVKVEEPEFTYTQPDQSQPMRDDIEYLDIFQDGDEIVEGLAKMTEGKGQMVTKDGTVFNTSEYGPGEKAVDEAFQKKIYKDIEGEEQIIPEPEGVGISKEGDVYGEEEFKEIIEGAVPDHLKKKAEGGIIETGNIARRPGAVPPLSGPTPQGQGILGLFSSPKRVNIA